LHQLKTVKNENFKTNSRLVKLDNCTAHQKAEEKVETAKSAAKQDCGNSKSGANKLFCFNISYLPVKLTKPDA
jgi:hypothetical protein